MIVVAHRGCHNPASSFGLTEAPENSMAALEHCVTMGVDMMETDIHMTLDGHLVVIHDDRVERTTDGHGAVAEMTLAEIQKLRLRQNLGGYAEPITNDRVLTLNELLSAARGRITLNLDVKSPIYAEVVDAVLRAGDADLVTLKTRAGLASPALAGIEPFDRVSFVPVLQGKSEEIGEVAERQATGTKPVAFELPRMTSDDVAKVTAVAQRHGVRLFSNTLGDGFITPLGGDNDALIAPDSVWGWKYRHGISVFQTDRPEALLRYRTTLKE